MNAIKALHEQLSHCQGREMNLQATVSLS